MARILVVDDDSSARLLIRTLAEHAGHEVLEASGGAQGIALAIEAQPDLIVLDLAMPQMSGSEFVRALRKDRRAQHSRIALYTAAIRSAAIDDFIEIYGIAGTVPKPGEPAQILASIEAALHGPSKTDHDFFSTV